MKERLGKHWCCWCWGSDISGAKYLVRRPVRIQIPTVGCIVFVSGKVYPRFKYSRVQPTNTIESKKHKCNKIQLQKVCFQGNFFFNCSIGSRRRRSRSKFRVTSTSSRPWQWRRRRRCRSFLGRDNRLFVSVLDAIQFQRGYNRVSLTSRARTSEDSGLVHFPKHNGLVWIKRQFVQLMLKNNHRMFLSRSDVEKQCNF